MNLLKAICIDQLSVEEMVSKHFQEHFPSITVFLSPNICLSNILLKEIYSMKIKINRWIQVHTTFKIKRICDSLFMF